MLLPPVSYATDENKQGFRLLSDLSTPRRYCIACAIHHERNARQGNTFMYVARTRNNRMSMAFDRYCCLLPQC